MFNSYDRMIKCLIFKWIGYKKKKSRIGVLVGIIYVL